MLPTLKSLPPQKHLFPWGSYYASFFPYSLPESLLSILYSINYICVPRWSLSTPRPTIFLPLMQVRKDPGGKSGNRDHPSRVESILWVEGSALQSHTDHTFQTTHAPGALPQPPGQRNLVEGKHNVIPGSVPAHSVHSVNTLRIMIFFFWLHWVFVAARGLSLVAASGGYSSLWCAGFSLQWLLLLRSTGSRRVGFSSCGMRAQ